MAVQRVKSNGDNSASHVTTNVTTSKSTTSSTSTSSSQSTPVPVGQSTEPKQQTAAQQADPNHPVVGTPVQKSTARTQQERIQAYLQSNNRDEVREELERDVIREYLESQEQYKGWTEEELSAEVEKLYQEEKANLHGKDKNYKPTGDIEILAIEMKYSMLKDKKISIVDFNKKTPEERQKLLREYSLTKIVDFVDSLVSEDFKKEKKWDYWPAKNKLSYVAGRMLESTDPNWNNYTKDEKRQKTKDFLTSLIEPNYPGFSKLDSNSQDFLLEQLTIGIKAAKKAGISPNEYMDMSVSDKNKLITEYYNSMKAPGAKGHNTAIDKKLEITLLNNNLRYAYYEEYKKIPNSKEFLEYLQKQEKTPAINSLIKAYTKLVDAGITNPPGLVKSNEACAQENGITVQQHIEERLEAAFASGNEENVRQELIEILKGAVQDNTYDAQNIKETFNKFCEKYPEYHMGAYDFEEYFDAAARKDLDKYIATQVVIDSATGDNVGVVLVADNGLKLLGSSDHMPVIKSSVEEATERSNQSENLEIKRIAYKSPNIDLIHPVLVGDNKNKIISIDQRLENDTIVLKDPYIPDANKTFIAETNIALNQGNYQIQEKIFNAYAPLKDQFLDEGLAGAIGSIDDAHKDQYNLLVSSAIENSGFSEEVKNRLNKVLETGQISEETISKSSNPAAYRKAEQEISSAVAKASAAASSSEAQSGAQGSGSQVNAPGSGIAGGVYSVNPVAQAGQSSMVGQTAQVGQVSQSGQSAQSQALSEQSRAAIQQALTESYDKMLKSTMDLLDKISKYETEKAERNQKRLEEIAAQEAKQEAARKADAKAAIEKKRRIAASKQSDEQARVNEKTIEQASLEARIHAGLETGGKTPEDVIHERLHEAYTTNGIEGFYNELFNVFGRNNALSRINANADYRRKFIQHCKTNVSMMRDLLSQCATDDERLEILRQVPATTASQLMREIAMTPSAMEAAVSSGTVSASFAYDYLLSMRQSSDFADYVAALKSYLPLEIQNELMAMVNGSNGETERLSAASSRGGSSSGGSTNRRATAASDDDIKNLRQYLGLV